MKIRQINWENDSIWHIAKHAVEPREVEEVCFESNPFFLKTKFNRYIVLGKTANGRYLTIIFEYLGQNRAKIITARAMSEPEKRLYKRR